jgi:exodeoxyribonuclease VII small subunit
MAIRTVNPRLTISHLHSTLALRREQYPLPVGEGQGRFRDRRASYNGAMKDMTFEQGLTRLEEIVRKMEQGEVSLDASLALFEEGVALSRHCANKLDEAEKRIAVLTEDDSGGIEEQSADGELASSYETSEILGAALRDSSDG